MTWFNGLIVFFLVWWTALFCVLPIGVRPDVQGDPEAGGWRGAPTELRFGRKLLLTTALSAVIWLGIYWLVESDWLSFRSDWLAIPD